MKNYVRKITALLLLALMILPACQKAPANDDVTTGPTSETKPTDQVQYDEWGREMVFPNLPSDLNYQDATVNILAREAFIREFFAEADSQTVVSDAVYRRNLAVEETLGVKLNVIPGPLGKGDDSFSRLVSDDFLGGDHAYDIIAPYAYFGVSMITGGYLYDLTTISNLDLSSRWWNQSYRNVISVSGREFAAVGDISLSSTSRTFVMFFNKQLLRDVMPDYNIYDVVRSGKWTLDEFATLTKAFYKDDGNGQVDFDDTYGFAFTAESGLQNGWEPALGIQTVKKDGDVYTLNILDSYVVEAFDGLYSALCENPGVLKHPRTNSSTQEVIDKFIGGTALMTMHEIDLAESNLVNMEITYGIVPIPKFREQDNYQTTPQDAYSFIAVMGTEINPAMIGAVLEQMAYESYMKITPAYYEVSMKNRYLRTDETNDDIDMYDIVMNSVVFDFGVVYANDLDNISNVIRKMITDNKNNYVSQMSIREKRVQSLLDTLIETFNEI